jgi:hypothetical protein
MRVIRTGREWDRPMIMKVARNRMGSFMAFPHSDLEYQVGNTMLIMSVIINAHRVYWPFVWLSLMMLFVL